MPPENRGSCEQPSAPQEVCQKPCLTKRRYVELVQLGLIASEELTKHGLKREEYCEFGRIMEKIMQLE
jgi:hypothetical protein